MSLLLLNFGFKWYLPAKQNTLSHPGVAYPLTGKIQNSKVSVDTNQVCFFGDWALWKVLVEIFSISIYEFGNQNDDQINIS